MWSSEASVNTGVYAVPELIEAAAYEFAEMEDLLVAAENLYGSTRGIVTTCWSCPRPFRLAAWKTAVDVRYADHHRRRPQLGFLGGPRIGAQLEATSSPTRRGTTSG